MVDCNQTVECHNIPEESNFRSCCCEYFRIVYDYCKEKNYGIHHHDSVAVQCFYTGYYYCKEKNYGIHHYDSVAVQCFYTG